MAKTLPCEAELFIRADAAKDPNSLAGRLKEERLIGVAERLQRDLPEASSDEIRAWLAQFERDHPEAYRPCGWVGDLKTLTARERHEYANGVMPAPKIIPRGARK